eukprot:GHRQ01026771.1.p1 GENE.GHRQ01026771.1~~GHRQ01026771.1.p1  ORF type:complete len:133 (+),score=30.60 GHRQ01026771.1:753-1151(+)
MLLALRIMLLPDCCADALPALPAGSPNTFQNRSVSSAPAVTTLLPSGDWAMCSTRAVWPPWLDRISRSWRDHCSAHTWLPVSMELSWAPVLVFQNLQAHAAQVSKKARRGQGEAIRQATAMCCFTHTDTTRM